MKVARQWSTPTPPSTLLGLLSADLLFLFYTGLKNNATTIFVMLVGGYIEIALKRPPFSGLRILISKMANKALILILPVMPFSLLSWARPAFSSTRLGVLFAGACGGIMKLADRVSQWRSCISARMPALTRQLCRAASSRIAQQMVELPPSIRHGFPSLLTAIIVLFTIIYAMRYAVRVSKDPPCSIMGVRVSV